MWYPVVVQDQRRGGHGVAAGSEYLLRGEGWLLGFGSGLRGAEWNEGVLESDRRTVNIDTQNKRV